MPCPVSSRGLAEQHSFGVPRSYLLLNITFCCIDLWALFLTALNFFIYSWTMGLQLTNLNTLEKMAMLVFATDAEFPNENKACQTLLFINWSFWNIPPEVRCHGNTTAPPLCSLHTIPKEAKCSGVSSNSGRLTSVSLRKYNLLLCRKIVNDDQFSTWYHFLLWVQILSALLELHASL